ncbi:MAG: M48 family metallopeptidase [PVC group bacterium]
MKKYFRYIFAGLIFLGFLTGCATVPYTGRSQLSLVPDSQIMEMSRSSYQQVLSESKRSGDRPAAASVKRVGQRIAASAEDFMREQGYAGEVSTYDWEFTLLEDNEAVNAWCMPGGKIVVYTGILPVTRDDTGLAVVMGHEVAHALAGHGRERVSQLLLYQLGAIGLSQALREEPETTQALWLAAYGLGSQVGILLPYSRTQEYEADRIGLILTAKAGYDPRESIPFWERMMAKGESMPIEFLSTHPATENRLQEIRGMMPEALRYYQPR